MSISTTFVNWYISARQNRWMRYFAVFNRFALAAGFFPAGLVKVLGERFTSLSNNHPMGQYLEALFHTGYYYTFIGIAQMLAAILLLIPRTVVLGALLYFPIIVNICILSLSVRFDGSLLSSPLMVLSNIFLLCWNYDKLQHIFPFKAPKVVELGFTDKPLSNKFPAVFFIGVICTILAIGFTLFNIFDIRPRNTLKDCIKQCKNSRNQRACCIFCERIHLQGKPLNKSLDEYHDAVQHQLKK